MAQVEEHARLGTRGPSDAQVAAALSDPQRLAAVERVGILRWYDNPELERIARLAAVVLDCDVGMLSILTADRHILRYATGLPGSVGEAREMPITDSYCKYVVALGLPVVVKDALPPAMTRENPAIADLDVVAYAGAPLRLSTGAVIGALAGLSANLRHWSPSRVAALQELAHSATAEIELRAEHIGLGERHDEQARMLAQLSHELRTPLTSITGFGTTLETMWHDLGDQRKLEFVSIIRREGDRLHRLVDDLLLSMQLQLDALQLSPTTFKLFPLARAALEDAALDPRSSVDVPDGLQAYADPFYVEQMIAGYVSNAVKYGAQPIDVSAARAGTMVEVRVLDHGAGVEAEFEESLFSPFARSEAARKSGKRGTGLGLSNVLGLARRMGGDAWYERAETGGSCFALSLPTAPPT